MKLPNNPTVKLPNNLPVVFFGSSKYVLPIIEVLKKNFDLVCVVTTEKNPTDPVPAYCVKSKVCYYVVTDFWKNSGVVPRSRAPQNDDCETRIKQFNPDIGILASFGVIVPKSVLDIFRYGVLNIHPSLLPKYRGPTPVQTAILNGDKTTGVSIMKLDEQVDHGPILYQKKQELFSTDTSESLHERLFKLGASSLVRVIEQYLKEEIKPREQNHKQASFTKMLTRKHGFIDFQSPPSPQTLDRMIRAYHPWPGTWTRLRSGKPNFGGQAKSKVVKFLPDKKIQVEGKKPMSYKDFVNGYPETKNLVLPVLQNNFQFEI